MGRPRKVVEGADHSEYVDALDKFNDKAGDPYKALADVAKDVKAKINIPSLKEYVSQCEAKAQPLTLVEVTHPECKDGDIYAGVYSGIRMINSDTPSAKLSSGEVI